MKYKLALGSIVVVLFLTYMANLVELSVLNSINTEYTLPDNVIDQAFSILETFGRIITFRLIGFPTVVQAFFNIFLIYPIMFFWLLLIANFIRGVE